jgi:DNA-binding response OmpR family regulator
LARKRDRPGDKGALRFAQGLARGKKLLIIDDDPALVKLLKLHLEIEGYEVYSALDGIEGLRCAFAHRPDLIILDVMMPRMDGWTTCQRLRQMGNTPIIMLTAKVTIPDRVKGLSEGADDYVTKPFDMEELSLRIEAVLRRAERTDNPDKPLYYDDGWLRLDLPARSVLREGRPVDLTQKEFGLLAYLFTNAGKPLRIDEILDRVWLPEEDPTPDLVKVHVRHLRQKIEREAQKPQYILTKRGRGYLFRSLKAQNG